MLAPPSTLPAKVSFVESADHTRWDGANWSKNWRWVRKSAVGVKLVSRRVSRDARSMICHAAGSPRATWARREPSGDQ